MRDQRRNEERRDQHADTGTKCQAPAQRADKQPQIAGVADNSVDTAGDQRVPGLDGDQPAELIPQHKDGPEPQHAAAGRKK